jgi:repressor LexA
MNKTHRIIYEFIQTRLIVDGVSPSHREIMDNLAINSKRQISETINALVTDGWLSREEGKQRNLSLTPLSSPQHTVLGRISAGRPVEAIPDDQRYNLYSVLFPPGAFALVVGGDSMIDEGLFDGDIVIMLPAQTAKNGQIVYAQIDGSEATLKRLYVRPDRIILKPCNPTYQPMEYSPDRVEVRAVFHKGIAMSR